tara:strand:- start:431 stop:2206 length:1776 start_codon:yes stop_codon:yes gene_type:complete
MRKKINWDDINLGNKTSGQVKVKCPNCSDSRNNKSDRSLSVNITEGKAHCHYCSSVSFREDVKEDVVYEVPPQDWSNYTSLSDKMVKWFKDSRGISQKTLVECMVSEKEYFFPQKNKNMNAIAFNYFDGKTLITSKYRSAEKDFMQTPNTKKIFYGLNDIKNCNEIIVVEGEIDKLSFWEAGIKNVISVPNGASDISLFERDAELFEEKKVVIAVDKDRNGRKLEKEIISAIGKKHCLKIDFPYGCKDANDVISTHSTLKLLECYENRKSYRLIDAEKRVASSENINKQTRDFLEGRIELGMKTGIPILDKHFVFKKNEFYLLTGSKGYGKSTIHQTLLLMGSISNGLKFMTSFKENSDWSMNLNLMNYLCRGWSKDFLKTNPKAYSIMESWVAEHFLYVDVDSIDELTETAEAYIEDKGIDIFAILADPINSYTSKSSKNSYDVGTDNANKLLKFSMKTASVMISQHPNLSAQRTGDLISSTDGQGGQYYSKASMAYVIHREKGSSLNELHIENVRTKATGGSQTDPENPIVINWSPTKISISYLDGSERIDDVFEYLIDKYKPFGDLSDIKEEGSQAEVFNPTPLNEAF